MSNIVKLDKNNFREFIKKENYVFVDFYSDWCSPCKKVPPILEKLKEEFPEIEIAKLDAAEEVDIASEFGIFSVPVVIVFKEGKEVKRFTGVPKYNKLKEVLNT